MSKAALRFACLAVLQGCSYTTETIGDQSELDAVFTVRQAGRDFDGLQTFAMPESVADLSNLAEDPKLLTDAYDQDFIDAVADHMAEAGWQRVGDLATADVLILNGKVGSDNSVSFSYWYAYYPYYIYYPYYPVDTVTVSYPVGTLTTVMLDHNALEAMGDIETVPALWAAAGLGLLNSNASTKARVERMVDEAFVQSDYLVVGDSVDPVHGLDVPLPPV